MPPTSNRVSPSKKRKTTAAEGEKYAQVLIIARVDKTNLTTDEWANWIREMPSDGKEVHVEGRWDSFSTLPLLRIPIAVWNLLPDNEAYGFVGFVTLDKLAASQVHPSECHCPCENLNRDTTSSEDTTFDMVSDNHTHRDIQLQPSPIKVRTSLMPKGPVSARMKTENGYNTNFKPGSTYGAIFGL